MNGHLLEGASIGTGGGWRLEILALFFAGMILVGLLVVVGVRCGGGGFLFLLVFQLLLEPFDLLQQFSLRGDQLLDEIEQCLNRLLGNRVEILDACQLLFDLLQSVLYIGNVHTQIIATRSSGQDEAQLALRGYRICVSPCTSPHAAN